MLKKYVLIISMIFFLSFLSTTLVFAQDEAPAGDEGGTFVSVAPDALIVLDLSGSMLWSPVGAYMYVNSSHACTGSNIPHYGFSDATHNKLCTIDAYGTVPRFSNQSCTGPFYTSSQTNFSTDCRRLNIAKRALFNILDDDGNNVINVQDANSLQVRIGYMRFYNCSSDDTGNNYSSGCNRLITTLSDLGKETGTSYQKTYCGNSTSCAATASSCSSGSCVAGESATGGTPLATALKEAKLYLDAHKDKDKAKACRQKFVIMITDGADTFACSGNGAECQGHQYKRRRDSVAAAKALNDAGYKVFVIGFGADMPGYLKNTLEWAAYYGGTDNPLVENTVPATSYDPAAITSCQTDTATETNSDCGASTANFKATNNDPGYLPLGGYAFLAANSDDLTGALRSAISTIREATYSFTQASIQAVRTIDENFLYEASFLPKLSPNNDPFWPGHLKRYSIDSDGNIATTADWDAGAILQARSADTRNIYTYKSGSLVEFKATNITIADLGVPAGGTADAQRLAIINFIRGGEQSGADAGWKLGDIYHSSPVTIGSPSAYFYDRIDTATTKAFDIFRNNNQRPSSSGKRLILAGANDGQFHAFKTGEVLAGGGSETWSFIPPNLMPKLKTIAHSTHPTSLGHQYFVDGPIFASDIWLGTGAGTTKSSADWRTLVVFGLGRGGTTHLWSSSAYCDSGINNSYSSTYAYYCGYYAFDITDTTVTPTFKWHLGGTTALTATEGNHLGQPWSKMNMGRVKINGNEKWVGFIGGGYSGTDCKTGGSCDTRGKGFYVIDLSNGSILWTFTHSGPAGVVNADMDYSLPGPAALIDFDNDGFIDTAYIGDLGGNVWRFKFCLGSASGCTTSDWSGSAFYAASSGNIRPIYTMPTVAKDNLGNMWVYFGTGDLADPTASNAQEKMYALKDNDRTTSYSISNMENITSAAKAYDGTKNGWYINLSGTGQKILAEPTVFQGVLYFTSYNPANANDPCETGGEASLHAVDYKTGEGKWESTSGTTSRSKIIGSGMPSAPVVSLNPYGGTNIYASTSESDTGGGAHTQNIVPPTSENLNRGNLLYWRDLRVQ